MKIYVMRQFFVLFVCACLGWAGLAVADVVTDWNDLTSQAIVASGTRPGPLGTLDLAMVHVAIHDSVQAYDKQFEPYCAEIAGATGSSIAAAATAAHDVLVNRFPTQAPTIDMQYTDYLTNNGLLPNDPGVPIGAQAALCIINLRANDGSFPLNQEPFMGGTDPGEWRPTPPLFTAGVAPWLGDVTPYTLKKPSQFHAPPPPELTSSNYSKDYKEVQALGGTLLNSERTPEQTDLAYFYSENFIVLWYRGLRGIADQNIDNIGDSARLFALISIAAVDSGITCWHDKFTYVFWRPITAIQEGDNDGNKKTIGDVNWLPLNTTPAYPDHTSGANNLIGSGTKILQLFFGTNEMTFTLTSTFPLAIQKSRTYTQFTALAEDVVNVRVYQGIHFRSADEAGRKQGRHVAKWVFKNVLSPVQ